MDRRQEHSSLKTSQPRCVISGEQLGEEPTRRVNSWNQADQCGGTGHRSDKEGQDRSKGSETNRRAEQAAIHHIDNDVIAQMLARKLFYLGHGEHRLILPFREARLFCRNVSCFFY